MQGGERHGHPPARPVVSRRPWPRQLLVVPGPDGSAQAARRTCRVRLRETIWTGHRRTESRPGAPSGDVTRGATRQVAQRPCTEVEGSGRTDLSLPLLRRPRPTFWSVHTGGSIHSHRRDEELVRASIRQNYGRSHFNELFGESKCVDAEDVAGRSVLTEVILGARDRGIEVVPQL